MFWNNPAENAGKIQAMDRVLQINSCKVSAVSGGGKPTPLLLTKDSGSEIIIDNIPFVSNTMNNFFFSINAIINLLCERTEMNKNLAFPWFILREHLFIVFSFSCCKVKYASLSFKIAQEMTVDCKR